MNNAELCHAHARVRLARDRAAALKVYDDREGRASTADWTVKVVVRLARVRRAYERPAHAPSLLSLESQCSRNSMKSMP
jgi:hypothetical protein